MKYASLAVLLGACAPPDASELFNGTDLVVADDEAAAANPVVSTIRDAEESLYVALPGGDDTDVSDAIVEAADRGVYVEVITDADLAASPAVTALTDAKIQVALRDNGLTYFDFDQNADLSYTSSQTLMSDAWVVANHQQIILADRFGAADDGPRVVFRAHGEDLVDDLLLEHNQVFGGTDATAVDAYSAPSKSILDTHWRYGTGTDTDFELYFGPQERLLKRVIDAVYSARASVWILTDDYASEGLSSALEDKAKWGLDVKVVVGPHFGETSDLLSRTLLDTKDVAVRQIAAGKGVDHVPTLVLIDYDDTSAHVRGYARAMVLTHDLFSAARLYRGDPVETDQIIDGTMYELSTVQEPSKQLLQLEQLFRDQYDLSEAL